MPQFVEQGKHYARSLGKDALPEDEVYGLAELYKHLGSAALTAADLAAEVRLACSLRHAACTAYPNPL